MRTRFKFAAETWADGQRQSCVSSQNHGLQVLRANGQQPARLADSEFVIPADVVSHLGNGSSKAGAKQLYAMMDRVRQARTGTKKQGKQINPRKYLTA